MNFLQRVYDIIVKDANPYDEPYKNWPFSGAAYPLILLTLAYVLFVFRIGPWLMRDRPPMKLRGVLIVYNSLQILINAFIFLSATYMVIKHPVIYDLGCIGKLPPQHPDRLIELLLCYAYFAIKIIDYCDTIFFVLRKSYKQVTFLHVYHHVLMALMAHIYLRLYGLSGHASFLGLVNSFVHAVMYGYYLLSSTRPDVQQSLWWKKYITILQLVQFVIILVQQSWPLLVRRSCTYPHIWLYCALTQAVFMIGLFTNFYLKAYVYKRPKTA